MGILDCINNACSKTTREADRSKREADRSKSSADVTESYIRQGADILTLIQTAGNYKGEHTEGQNYDKADIVKKNSILYFSLEDNNTDTPPSAKWLALSYSVVDTIEELESLDGLAGVAIVKDKNRGGTFVFDESRINENDGGVVFNGWVRQKINRIETKWFSGNDYEMLSNAIDASIKLDIPMFINTGIYNIGTQELLFYGSSMNIEADKGAEIMGSGKYIVTFAKEKGDTNNTNTNPTSLTVKNLTIRALAGGVEDGAACRISCSYSTFHSLSVITSDTSKKHGILLQSDDSGTGPYYNNIYDTKVQGPQNTLQEGVGIYFCQRESSSIKTRLPNTNTIVGGRVGGYKTNILIKGNGNIVFGTALENNTTFGTAVHFASNLSVDNVSNSVLGVYIENAEVGFKLDENVKNATIRDYYRTGCITTIDNKSAYAILISSANSVEQHAKGIIVGNTESTEYNVLDWYEEGGFLPTLKGSEEDGEYELNVYFAKYTRIGNIVFVYMDISISEVTPGAGVAIFGGLQFYKKTYAPINGQATLTSANIDDSVIYVNVVQTTSSISKDFRLQGVRKNTSPLSLSVDDIKNARVSASFTYIT